MEDFFTFLEPASGGNMFFDFFYAINEEKLKTNFLFAYFGAYKKMLNIFNFKYSFCQVFFKKIIFRVPVIF